MPTASTPAPGAPARPIRVLVAKPGLDGHDRGAKVVAAAVQEDVDVVGLSVLSGAHMTLFPRVVELLREAGRGDVLLTGGGIIPREDVASLQARGVGHLFGPGTPTTELIAYIRDWARQHLRP